MSNEHPKPAPNYEMLEANENGRLALIRKVTTVDFKLDDVLNFIKEAEADKEKTEAQVKYNDGIIENITGFHPEVAEFYNSLEGEKQSAFLLLAKAIMEKEKYAHLTKKYATEIDEYNKEVGEIETALGISTK